MWLRVRCRQEWILGGITCCAFLCPRYNHVTRKLESSGNLTLINLFLQVRRRSFPWTTAPVCEEADRRPGLSKVTLIKHLGFS